MVVKQTEFSDDAWTALLSDPELVITPLNTGSEQERDDSSDPVVTLIADMASQDPERCNAGWWTRDGKPDATELSRRLERRISAGVRDRIWDTFKTREQ